MSGSSQGNTTALAPAASFIFSASFSALEANPAAWSESTLVTTAMSGRSMRASRSISPGREIPASKMPRAVPGVIPQSDSGTPICEL